MSLATIASLEQYAAWRGRPAKMVTQLLPTCPLRNAEHVRAAVSRAFIAAGSDFLLSCTDYGPTTPWWGIEIGGDGEPRALFP